MLVRLLGGYIFIPFSYYIYTLFAAPRYRCHVPSWSLANGHYLFELVPYIFVGTSFFLLFRTARYALLHSSELLINIMTIGLAFWFSVFTFAVGYYQFGLMEQPDIYPFLVDLFAKAQISDERLRIMGVEFSNVGSSAQASYAITRDIIDYVLYAMSAPLGDDKITGVVLCPAATFLRVTQDLSNVAFGLLSVIVLVRFEPPAKSETSVR